jgi:hypothetical protein
MQKKLYNVCNAWNLPLKVMLVHISQFVVLKSAYGVGLNHQPLDDLLFNSRTIMN